MASEKRNTSERMRKEEEKRTQRKILNFPTNNLSFGSKVCAYPFSIPLHHTLFIFCQLLFIKFIAGLRACNYKNSNDISNAATHKALAFIHFECETITWSRGIENE